MIMKNLVLSEKLAELKEWLASPSLTKDQANRIKRDIAQLESYLHSVDAIARENGEDDVS